ncbi:MAG: ribonuclease E inhibitor RraB [Limisphaerales bacterium]
MSVVEILLNTAVEDSRLLLSNQELGDDVSKPRDLDFVLYSKDQERADLVASFVTDNCYGRPSVERMEQDNGSVLWRLIIAIHAPSTQNVVQTLSAFMVCLAQIYELEYDGGGCVIQKGCPTELPPAKPHP